MRFSLATRRRSAVAAVEFAVCAPVIFTLLLGLWEVGRMTEVSNVMWNSSREAARDASLGTESLSSVANHLLVYLQAAEPHAFGKGHSTQMQSPVITLADKTYGYTCWDTTDNKELFTIVFKDCTTTSVTDPTGMKQLDRFELNVQVPYSSIAWFPVSRLTGTDRLTVTVDWVSMVDSPFEISPYLPAQ